MDDHNQQLSSHSHIFIFLPDISIRNFEGISDEIDTIPPDFRARNLREGIEKFTVRRPSKQRYLVYR